MLHVVSPILLLNFKGIGLQSLPLTSEDGGWKDQYFATNFMKIR